MPLCYAATSSTVVPMRELKVLGVRVQLPDNQPLVLLGEVDGERYLPIWIGAPEASAINLAHQGIAPPRPLTHDLMANLMERFGHELTEVRIVRLVDNVYYSELHFADGTRVESRTSDAIALALRTGCSIIGADDVLDEGGVELDLDDMSEATGSGQAEFQEQDIEEFRQFLDNVSATDFGKDGDTPGPPG